MDSRIPAPVPAHTDAMKRVVGRLREIGFDEKHCGERLGKIENLPDFAGSQVARPYLRPSPDLLDIAITLFLMNEKISFEQAGQLFPGSDLDALRTMSLVEVNRREVYSRLNLLPCYGSYLATDRSSFGPNENPGISRVMWLYQESYILGGLVDRTTRLPSALDLGTGSGIHALLASQHCDHAVGVDINPRAITFSKFNQRLNDRSNLEYLLGDLYTPVAGRRFDLILANPPYNPSPLVAAGADYWSGGLSGEEILGRIFGGIHAHLTETGICHIITLLCHQKAGPIYRQKLDSWLVGGIRRYDIMAQVMEHQYYVANADSEALRTFLRRHFSRFEFGVISIRRSPERPGFYYHGLPRAAPPLFDENGRFGMAINHSFFDACKAEMDGGGVSDLPSRGPAVPADLA
ncbi:MAG TPA: methyltransferase [Candidatus Angelobacter sp.]